MVVVALRRPGSASHRLSLFPAVWEKAGRLLGLCFLRLALSLQIPGGCIVTGVVVRAERRARASRLQRGARVELEGLVP